MISMPFPSIIIRTRFLPISCMSPFTVPIQAFPSGSAASPERSGFKRAVPAFIARAATNTSGTNTSSFLNFSPMMFIPLKSPSFKMVVASIPSSIACCTSFVTSFFFPLCKASEISLIIDIMFSSSCLSVSLYPKNRDSSG